ncbi:hypothetical protein TERMP_01741 [Thermococcus barophilus MP]|uniref:Uncharacterized protein n=1 Tax=Thermococcus barophilus (strain DSM 11836 / MP) TaxID=391623 RepID=F0LJS4_THEBM|nr:hypothetical protein TERMP_01741 [Thermococcus barophilus MP]
MYMFGFGVFESFFSCSPYGKLTILKLEDEEVGFLGFNA